MHGLCVGCHKKKTKFDRRHLCPTCEKRGVDKKIKNKHNFNDLDNICLKIGSTYENINDWKKHILNALHIFEKLINVKRFEVLFYSENQVRDLCGNEILIDDDTRNNNDVKKTIENEKIPLDFLQKDKCTIYEIYCWICEVYKKFCNDKNKIITVEHIRKNCVVKNLCLRKKDVYSAGNKRQCNACGQYSDCKEFDIAKSGMCRACSKHIRIYGLDVELLKESINDITDYITITNFDTFILEKIQMDKCIKDDPTIKII